MTKIKSFIPYKGKQQLSEIYQNSGARFAFISSPKKGSKQCTPWVKCRDFLHDAFRAYVTKSSCKIYGFSYQFGKDPDIDTLRTRMLVRYDKPAGPLTDTLITKGNITRGIALVNHYERMAEIPTLTSAYKLDAKLNPELDKDVWVVTGPQFWLRSPALLSMFTFLLRLGEKKEIQGFDSNEQLEAIYQKIASPNAPDNDLKYLSKNWKLLGVVVKNAEELLFNGNLYESCITLVPPMRTSTYHDKMGITSLCSFVYGDSEKTKVLKKIIEDAQKVKGVQIRSDVSCATLSPYITETLFMSLVHFNKDKEFVGITGITSCRESIAYSMCKYFCRDTPVWAGMTPKEKDTIDKELAMFIYSGRHVSKGKREQQQDILNKALHILNHYEDISGIKKTTIQNAENVFNALKQANRKEITLSGWLLSISEEWFSSSVMLSSFIYIFRAARSAISAIGLKEGEINEERIDKLWKDFAKVCPTDKDSDIWQGIKKIEKILKNRSFLFLPEDNYLFSRSLQDFRSIPSTKTGVRSLLTRMHYDRTLNTKYKQLEEKA